MVDKQKLSIKVSSVLKRFGMVVVLGAFFLALQCGTSWAADPPKVNDIVKNIIESVKSLPGFIAAIAYLLGTLFCAVGITKLKGHVENPTQVHLKSGVIRFAAGGAFFALPTIYDAAFNAISGGTSDLAIDNGDALGSFLGDVGSITSLVSLDFNYVLRNIIDSISDLPGLLSAFAYLMGLLLGVSSILKFKDHVENPEQKELKEGVIRILLAGALFALPTIYNAMFVTVAGEGLGVLGKFSSFVEGLSMVFSTYAPSGHNICEFGSATIGSVVGILSGGGSKASMGSLICGIISSTFIFPLFLTACAYMIGLVFGVWGLFKIKAHVLNPQQTALWEGGSRLLAGGGFFALPFVISVARETLMPTASLNTVASVAQSVFGKGYNSGGVSCGGGIISGMIDAGKSFLGLGGGSAGAGPSKGLDGMLVCFMSDIMGPLHIVLNFFTLCAGIIFIMIGISRLIKSAQDGPKGPGGLGTIMTFLTGAALISYNQMVSASTVTFFAIGSTATYATMQYTTGMSAAETGAAHAVISAILQFVIIVGLFSFVRGIFIIRSVAEGNSQASMMAGLTHIIAGTLAVNLGPLLNAVQSTLGIGEYGIAFS